jgi:uncharacterized protein (TIGR03066 family)
MSRGSIPKREAQMKILRLLVAGMMVFALTTSIKAETKDEKPDNAKLLLGIWKVATADRDAALALGDSTEFCQDGSNTTTRMKSGKEVVSQGTYLFEKDRLVITFKSEKGVPEKELTIKKITDMELVLANDEGRKVIELRKVLPRSTFIPQNPVPRLYGGVPHFYPGRFYHGGYPPGR